MKITPGSFADHVVTFFRANPEEELSVDDCLVKWPLNKQKAVTILKRLSDEGYVSRRPETTPKGGHRFIYMAGVPVFIKPRLAIVRAAAAIGEAMP